MARTITLPRTAGSGFLAGFSLQAPLREADPDRALPEIRYGITPNEQRVLIRTWKDPAVVQTDLNFFWSEELRTHRRVQSRNQSLDCFGAMITGGSDAQGYHLVIARNERYLLADIQQRPTYRPARSATERARQWRGIARLARAICTLHAEGITHGSIDAWSVLVDSGARENVQLTGFEWAWRRPIVNANARVEDYEEAFAQDWRDLASVVCTLIATEDELEREERSMLRDLAERAGSNDRRIVKRIESIADRLAGQPRAPASQSLNENITAFADGLLVLLLLQCTLSAAQECAVRIERVAPRGRRHHVVIRARDDPEREKLSALLGSNGPASERLHRLLVGEHSASIESWSLWDFGTGTGERVANLYFVRVLNSHRGTYLFETDVPLGSLRTGVLINSKIGRWDYQFRRQLASWVALKEHKQLLESLIDPLGVTSTQSFDVLEDDTFSSIDKDKQQAIRTLLTVSPLFLVHGPPGVGKTRLVTEFARQHRRCAPHGKMLLSAQSHAAVDQLLNRLASKQESSSLLVRCRVRGAQRPSTEWDQSVVAQRVLKDVLVSGNLAKASDDLKSMIWTLVSVPTEGRIPKAVQFNTRPLEALLLRSADFVFGTSNCAAFEYLRAAGVDFDWSVVEEAAKATGPELLNSLLLAPRRLMIGDHRQLPAFNSTELIALLSDSQRIGSILQALQTHAGGEERRAIRRLRQQFEDPTDPRIALLCAHARRGLLLFESLMPSSPSPATFTHELTFQHRMHPAIARVVSNAFYQNKLQSSEECKDRFNSEVPPVRSARPVNLPDLPLVWIDMPWVQSTTHLRSVEHRPGPHNPDEVKVVIQAVTLLEPRQVEGGKKKTSLAILTPYRKQLQVIEEAIEQQSAFKSSLERFRPVGGSFVHTVDSFQGNEADVVIVSLVRNNGRSSLQGALGFLSDERRMNVLLSRAEWRLILVGCQEFLRGTVDRVEQAGKSDAVIFLRRLLESFGRERRDGHASIVKPWDEA